jgi:poly(A) polymerase
MAARKPSPEIAREAALAIVRTLRGAGHTAFFAGGCVRDELLGLSPTDYDVATDATPDQITALFRRTNLVGASFGVVLVTLGAAEGLPAQATVEVATFRSEGVYTDRRRPDSVSFSDARSDAMRRDFTVNALFLDPIGEGALPAGLAGAQVIPHPRPGGGRIIDLVGGTADLRAKRIRAVGDPDKRLAEDDLRALRAVRLSARLGFEIEASTEAAIRHHAGELVGISRERIGDELRRMLAHPSRGVAAAALQRLGLDGPVLSEDLRTPDLRVLSALARDADFSTCLAAWALDRGLAPLPADIEALAARWRSALCLSNEEADSLRNCLACFGAISTSWSCKAVAGRKRLAGQTPGFGPAMTILRAANPALAADISSDIARLGTTRSGLNPPPLLTGDDLIAAGFKPGPAFKGILDAVYDAQLEDRIQTSSEALELARGLSV